MKVIISKSNQKDKRFKATIQNKSINFGLDSAYTYFDGAPDDKRLNYIKRHSNMNEDWSINGIHTAGFWSRWFNWQLKNPSKQEQKKFFKKKFNIDLDITYFKKNKK